MRFARGAVGAVARVLRVCVLWLGCVAVVVVGDGAGAGGSMMSECSAGQWRDDAGGGACRSCWDRGVLNCGASQYLSGCGSGQPGACVQCSADAFGVDAFGGAVCGG
eukprot:3189152-Rhodomonas_salina.1